MNAKVISSILLFMLALSLSSSSKSCAEDKDGQVDKELLKQVAQIELNLTGKSAEHENLEQRLSSIETKLFGKEQSGTTFDRLENIRKNIAASVAQNRNAGGRNSDDWPALPGVTSATTPGMPPATTPAITPTTTTTMSPTTSQPAIGMQTSTSNQPITESASSQNLLSTPPSKTASTTNADSTATASDTEWPTALPHLQEITEPKRGPLKVEISQTAAADQAIVNSLKKAPEDEVDQRATKAFSEGKYALSAKLFDMLADRKPKDPRYVYGAGESYKMLGNYPSAFACLTMSWHLGNSDFYTNAIESLLPTMQKDYDDTFKIQFGHNADEPEAVLNAGVRMWKAGMSAQAVALFEYVMKNEPAYRGVAAYNLGAVAEHNNDPKLALEYYKWAVQENARLAATAEKKPQLAGAINKSSSLMPAGYIQHAVADLQQEMLRGHLPWNGWKQGTVHPEHWSSEVCPLCAISRTSLKYNPGQWTLE
jgi:hypothetical protein